MTYQCTLVLCLGPAATGSHPATALPLPCLGLLCGLECHIYDSYACYMLPVLDMLWSLLSLHCLRCCQLLPCSPCFQFLPVAGAASARHTARAASSCHAAGTAVVLAMLPAPCLLLVYPLSCGTCCLSTAHDAVSARHTASSCHAAVLVAVVLAAVVLAILPYLLSFTMLFMLAMLSMLVMLSVLVILPLLPVPASTLPTSITLLAFTCLPC